MDSLKAALSTALAESMAETRADSTSETLTVSPAQESPVSDPIPTPRDQSSLSAPQLRYKTEHASCAMCDSTLEIRHDVNRKDLKVKEEAHCPSCGIRVRSSHHLMH